MDTTLGGAPGEAAARRIAIPLAVWLLIPMMTFVSAGAAAVTLWHVVPATVVVTVETPGSTVYAGGRSLGGSPAILTDDGSGSHAVRVEASGYAPWQEVVSFDGRGVRRFAIALEPLPGPLTVESEPAGALVRLDGAEVGSTPLTVKAASAGRHQLAVSLDDHEDWSGDVLVPPGGGTTERFALRPFPAHLLVSALVDTATLFVDGDAKGALPQEVELSPGEHTVRVEANGHRSWQQAVLLRPNETRHLDLALQQSWPTADSGPIYPVAVVVENQALSRPQSGLGRADVVYEALAEGGITRFLALYATQAAEMVGPVRSARHYFVHWASEYQAPLVHVGASPQGYEAIDAAGTRNVDEIRGAKGFWRTHDRVAPHNLYTSTGNIKESLSFRPPSPGSLGGLHFKHEPLPQGGTPARNVWLKYGHWDYVVEWSYDPRENAYARWEDGAPLVDATTGEQIRASNVLIQWVDSWAIPGDPEYRLDFSQVGSGRLLALLDGVVVEGRWSKPVLDGPTEYRDAQGQPLALNAGPTWIQIVPLDAVLHL